MKERKTQIVFIHGGATFENDEDYLDYLKNRPISIEPKIKWSEEYFRDSLGNICNIIKPKMPLKENSRYRDWKIHFERYFDQLNEEIILIGISLGGIFLAKYLSENIFPKKILSVYLIAPPFENTLLNEKLAGGFELKEDLSKIKKNCEKINFLFSEDDDCVPISHAKKYKEKLKDVNIIIYKNKNGHFKISEFPEIVEMIKKDLHKKYI
jgi:uncharacterized protein